MRTIVTKLRRRVHKRKNFKKYGIRYRYSDKDEWGPAYWFDSKLQRDQALKSFNESSNQHKLQCKPIDN